MARRLPDDPSQLARFTTEKWGQLEGFYNLWAERWKRVIDYIVSLHWNAPRNLDPAQLPKWMRFPVVNNTLSIYNDYLNQWLQTHVRYSAVPASAESKDIASAELADQLLKYLWDRTDMETKRTDIGAWLLATGNADVRVFYNSDTGNMLPLAVPELDEQGQPTGKLIPINPQTMQADPTMQEPVMVDAGEIDVDVLAPHLTRWPARASEGVLVGWRLGFEDARSRYGKEMAESLSYGRLADGAYVDLLGFGSRGIATYDDETALVIEHYLPRSARYPNGLWWTSSNGHMVVEPADLPSRRVPIVHFRWIPLPGHRTMGVSPMYDITLANKELDRLLGKTLEWSDRMVPVRVRKSGDSLNAGELATAEEVVVPAGAEPGWDEAPQPPESLFRLMQDMDEDVMFVAGYRFQRRRDLPPGEALQRARIAGKMLEDGYQTALAVINSKAAWQNLGYVLLDYASKFYTEPRTISTLGPDNTYRWREFMGSDLDNMTATIHVDELPLYPWNRQSMRDNFIALLGTPGGQLLFQDPSGQIDRERVDAAVDALGLDVTRGSLDPDILEARNENYMFQSLRENEEPPQVQPWQDDVTHLEEHKRELKSLAFRGWSQQAQEAMLDHVSQHEQRIAEAQQSQQQAALEQEKQLREIRAQAETTQDVRTELGKQVAAAVVELLKEEDKESPKDKE